MSEVIKAGLGNCATDEETYQWLKRQSPNSPCMNADAWKILRLEQLRKEGKQWSK